MACETLAKLVTEALMGLGLPPRELAEIEDAARAVTQSLAFLKQHATFSSQNLDIQKYEWEPSSRTESLLAVADLQIPAWMERKVSSNVDPSDDFWEDVRVCNLAELESARTRGDFNMCAFYVINGQMYVKFSYDPQDYTYQTHRLWYSPSPIIAGAFDDLALDTIPQNFFPYVSALAELELIPTILIKIGASKNDSYKALEPGLKNRQEYLQVKANVWHDRFQHFTYGERGNRRGGRRRHILAKGITI